MIMSPTYAYSQCGISEEAKLTDFTDCVTSMTRKIINSENYTQERDNLIQFIDKAKVRWVNTFRACPTERDEILSSLDRLRALTLNIELMNMRPWWEANGSLVMDIREGLICVTSKMGRR